MLATMPFVPFGRLEIAMKHELAQPVNRTTGRSATENKTLLTREPSRLLFEISH